MASNAEELRRAQRMSRTGFLGANVTQEVTPQAIQRRANTQRGEQLGDQVRKRVADLRRDKAVATGLADEVGAILGKPAGPVAAAAALPSITGSQGSTLRRSTVDGVPTYSGTGAPGGEPGRSFVDRLAAFKEQNFATPRRETVDRGFQYQPSQYAQQVALRNAMIGNTRTLRDRRGRKVGEEFDQARFEANVVADPRLQGLARSKQYQDNLTADRDAAVTQRGQDLIYQTEANRFSSGERVAGARNAAELAKSQAERAFEAQKFGIERSDRLRQQNFENTETLLANRYQTEDGKLDTQRANQARRLLGASGLGNAPAEVQDFALNFVEQFQGLAGEGQALSQSSTAAFLPVIGALFRKDPQKFANVQQMQAAMKDSLADPRIIDELGLEPNQVDYLRQVLK